MPDAVRKTVVNLYTGGRVSRMPWATRFARIVYCDDDTPKRPSNRVTIQPCNGRVRRRARWLFRSDCLRVGQGHDIQHDGVQLEILGRIHTRDAHGP